MRGLGAQSNRPGDAFWEFQHQGSLSEPVDSGGGYYGGAPVVPPPVVPPFPDTNNNGIDDRLEGGGTTNEYDRFGQVVFPDMPPYNPGRDPEWLYFRKRAAHLGQRSYRLGDQALAFGRIQRELAFHGVRFQTFPIVCR